MNINSTKFTGLSEFTRDDFCGAVNWGQWWWGRSTCCKFLVNLHVPTVYTPRV